MGETICGHLIKSDTSTSEWQTNLLAQKKRLVETIRQSVGSTFCGSAAAPKNDQWSPPSPAPTYRNRFPFHWAMQGCGMWLEISRDRDNFLHAARAITRPFKFSRCSTIIRCGGRVVVVSRETTGSPAPLSMQMAGINGIRSSSELRRKGSGYSARKADHNLINVCWLFLVDDHLLKRRCDKKIDQLVDGKHLHPITLTLVYCDNHLTTFHGQILKEIERLRSTYVTAVSLHQITIGLTEILAEKVNSFRLICRSFLVC